MRAISIGCVQPAPALVARQLRAVLQAGRQAASARAAWQPKASNYFDARAASLTALARAVPLLGAANSRCLSASPPGFLSPDEAIDLVEKKKALLLDVREEYEFAEGHAARAINISVSELLDRMPEVHKLAGSKERVIVVYCRSGGRSHMAMEFLEKEGYKVFNLGGIIQASAAFEFWGSGSSVGPP